MFKTLPVFVATTILLHACDPANSEQANTAPRAHGSTQSEQPEPRPLELTPEARMERVADAHVALWQLSGAASAYYDTSSEQGDERQFPNSAPRTPSVVPCGDSLGVGEWSHPTWEALDFRIRDPQRYSFQFDSGGVGAEAWFIASAWGDLDCDGHFSLNYTQGRIEEGEARGELHEMDMLE